MVLLALFAFCSNFLVVSQAEDSSLLGQLEFALYIDDYHDGPFSGWTHIMAYNWEENRTVFRSSGSGAGAALQTLRDFQFQVGYSDFSPRLFIDCASGRHLTFAVLEVRQWVSSGETLVLVHYLKWYFTDVIIARYETSGSTGDMSNALTDEFAIAFGRIGVEYWPGPLDPSIRAGWDCTQNKQYNWPFPQPPPPSEPPWWSF
jgi:type VI secretion system secreted protein Hcp